MAYKKPKYKYPQITTKQRELLDDLFEQNSVSVFDYNPKTVTSLRERAYIEIKNDKISLTYAGQKLISKRRTATRKRKKLEKQFDLAWSRFGRKDIRIFADEGKDRKPVRILGDGRRFDFVFPDYQVAIEVQGAIYVGGAHVRGAQYERDCLKKSDALTLGWYTIELTSKDLVKKRHKQTVERVLRILDNRAKYAHIGLLTGANIAHINRQRLWLDAPSGYSVGMIPHESPLYLPTVRTICDTWLFTTDHIEALSYRREFVGTYDMLQGQREQFTERLGIKL